ncbi:hypothetical protein RvY_04353 [Ramazzottius varieornatus]|uniref:Gustatory receptor n=1 Tax=Ramazzottius varieornatus TaxID=947166 RepID=A0A1D1URC5_RAMVA|nr:hypothetical protein RvY_04353 [Ramazzottius varieornatus]
MQLFAVQELILKVCGFLPLSPDRYTLNSPRTRTLQYVLQTSLTFVAVCLLLGSFYDTVVHTVAVLYVFLQTTLEDPTARPSKSYKPDLLGVLSNLPFCAIHLRGLLVLYLFFRQRYNWSILKFELDRVIAKCLPVQSDPKDAVKKWTKISFFLSVFTFSLHTIWEIVEVVYYLAKEPENYGTYTKVFDPLPFKIRTDEYLTIYQLFCTIPYILSQQIYTLLIVPSGVLYESIDLLLNDIRNAQYGHAEITTVSGRWQRTLELSDTVDEWADRYRAIVEFVERLNESFSWILFAAYGLDFITVLGFAAGMASGAKELKGFFFLLTCATIFASYGTAYLIPMVKLHEKSLELPFALRQLRANVKMLASEGFLDRDERFAEREELLSKLDFLQATTHRHPCAVDAAEVFYITREVLVRTVTLNVSLVVLIKQLIMDKDDKHDVVRTSTLSV